MMFRIRLLLFYSLFFGLVACDDFDFNNELKTSGRILTVWTKADVRRVLNTFAYGGQASDAQIATWAAMKPSDAITEILTFDEVNDKLSPMVDNTAAHGGKLKDLMDFWSSTSVTHAENPFPDSDRLTKRYSTFYTYPDTGVSYPGQTVMANSGLQLTWVAAVNKSGLNPFRQKFGLFLTNYNMAVSLSKVTPVIIRDLYDSSMTLLQENRPYYEVLANGAYSAALALQYGHRSNTYDNSSAQFYGNDDFAREFYQLFFRILGDGENPDYHENVTIEHTAWILTGMNVDRDPEAYDWQSKRSADFWVAPINFTDHQDNNYEENKIAVTTPEGDIKFAYEIGTPAPRQILNFSNHYSGSLEVLHERISGATAKDKLLSLAEIAGNYVESLENLPVYIVNHFADDNLSAQKINHIQRIWKESPNQSVLHFLQQYAISDIFFRQDTYKFRNAFDRNLTNCNLNTVDNEEAYYNEMPISFFYVMFGQGAGVFIPAHDVFGGQTSLDAANNAEIFRRAYNDAVIGYWRVAVPRQYKLDENGAEVLDANGEPIVVWEKDWSRRIPTTRSADGRDVFLVDNVGEWLWKRFVADDLKNYTRLERAYVNAFLVTGRDFAQLAAEVLGRPFELYDFNNEQIQQLLRVHADVEMQLSPGAINSARTNVTIGMAINFIIATPFTFALGG